MVLNEVQKLANFFARQLQQRGVIDESTDTYRRLTQGLGAGDIAEAREFAFAATDIFDLLRPGGPGAVDQRTLEEFNRQTGGGIVQVVHVYGTRADADEPVARSGEYRTSLFGLNPGTSLEDIFSRARQKDLREWTPLAGQLDADYEVAAFLPFDLYS